MNNCLNCKHAEWARTKNGRVNPHQSGKCAWRKVVHVPRSCYTNLRREKDAPIVLEGGYIWRKSPAEKCPTFQPAD